MFLLKHFNLFQCFCKTFNLFIKFLCIAYGVEPPKILNHGQPMD